ncbi:MAG TPA: phosphatase PAP2 family protein [Gaiellaceae bacterium]|nr:phosphatase PAP2 family protein [Gaiellaceae bacterium]
MRYAAFVVVFDLARRDVVRPLGSTRVLRAAAVLAYLGFAATVVVSVGGIPASRDMLVPLLLVGVLAASVGSVTRLRRFFIGLAVEWAPLLLALWAYDLARALGSRGWFPVHFAGQIRIDRLIGGGALPTVWLQHHLWHGAAHIAWYDYVALATYVSYFLATPFLLVAFWWFRPAWFRELAVALVALALLSCVTFIFLPSEPPWLAARDGHLPPVHQLIGTLNLRVPLLRLDPLLERGTGYANIVAAFPSLHAAQTLLISLFLVRRLRTPWRHLLWLYPIVMAYALVYSGEHYVVDILFGWIYCVLVYAAVERARSMAVTRRAATVAVGPA